MKTVAQCGLIVIVIALAIAGCATKPAPATPAPNTVDTATPAPPTKTRPFPDDSFHDLLVAEFAVRRQQFDLALGYYMRQSAETRDPGVAARATRLAQFLKAETAASDAAQLWVEVEPSNLEAQYTTATLLARKQQPLEAMPHMVKVLNNGGKTNFPAIAASALRLAPSIRTQLEQQFDSLLNQHPSNSQLHTAKALLLQQRDQTEAALSAIRTAIKHDASDIHAVIIEARLLQQLGREDEAISRLSEVVDTFPDNRRLRLQYARLLMNRDIPLAQQQFEYLLQSTPNDPDLLLSLALITKETNQPQQSQQYFERLLLTGQRNNEAYYYLAQIAEQNHDWQQAIDWYSAIEPGADYLAASSRITQLYLQQGDTDSALQLLQQRRQQSPQLAIRFYLMEAELLLQNQRLSESMALLQEALNAHPEQPNLLYLRSLVSEKLGRFEQMEADLRIIIAQAPDNAVALNALGYVLANRGEQLLEARDLIQRALAAKPDDPAILDSLGWVEYRLGNLDTAQKLLQRAYDKFPDPEVAAHLGEVLWMQGQHRQAKTIWQQTLEQHPDSAPLLETLQRLQPAGFQTGGKH